ncbi:hypothetical protein [Pseudoflavonifractor sp. 524-17]|uniref:hypothetical protein n=1 Tax=Pseudoflavonifractor sp. 524-17 TaxID=2304577 RepID=UPI001379BAB5|nr:hypothetical protein [Pseudoflavonifractor sp. 524-17]
MKKVPALFLGLGLAVTLAACGGGGAAPTSVPPTATPTATPTPEPTPTPTPEPEKIPVYDVVEKKVYSSTYTYSGFVLDDAGRVVEKKVSGSERGTYTYEYSEEGQVLAENFTSNSGSYDNYTYTYNEFGLKETELEHSSGIRDGNNYVYEYEYDEQNRPVKMTSVNTNSDDGVYYSMIYTYEYGEDGNVAVETQTSYPDGLEGPAGNTYEIHHTYDEEGRLVKSVSQKKGESSTNTSTYVYDCVGYYTPAS